MGNYDLYQPRSNRGDHLFQNRHVQLAKFICPYLISTSLPSKVLQLSALAGVIVLLSNLSRGLHACSKARTSQYAESVIIICIHPHSILPVSLHILSAAENSRDAIHR